MATIRWTLIAVLCIAWTLPATGLAQPASPAGSSAPAQPAPARVEGRLPRSAAATPVSEAAGYAEREQQSQELQNYQGGALVIYIGGGAVLIALFILLLILV
jgi:hypothetical protein